MKSRFEMLKEIEKELNIRLRGHSQEPKASGSKQTYWKFRGTRGVGQRIRQLGQRGRTGGGSSVKPRQQRVVVKASYSVHKSGKSRSVLRAHVRYLGHHSASLDGEPGRFYDAREQEVEAKQRVQDWEQDRTTSASSSRSNMAT